MLRGLLALFPVMLGMSVYLVGAETPMDERRSQAEELFDDGNYKEAYDIVRALVLDPKNEGEHLAEDYARALECLQNLQRAVDIDQFREEAVKVHADDWRLLAAAAESLLDGEQYGFLVAGEFRRGDQRGGGQYVSSEQRDRVRALQLLNQARPLANQDDDKSDVSSFYIQLSNAVIDSREGSEAWRLQALTDLSVLPDYEETQRWRGRWGWGGGQQAKGAPVDAEGKPVLYAVPESWDAARSDGERWRWALSMAVENEPSRKSQVAWTFAEFLHSQFGVQTMQQWGVVLPRSGSGDGNDVDESGPYALHSLGEDETIARLATGIKRFKLPDEYNPIRIWQGLAQDDDSGYAESALGQLAQCFEDRQQYDRAAGYWKESIERFQDDDNKSKQARLDQIIGNWGQFENTASQPAGKGATAEFRFRNGKKLHLEAHLLRVSQLLTDVQAYLKSNPQQLDWQKLQIDNIGQRLVDLNESKYRGEQVAVWDLELEPRPEHFDRRITITTPLQKAGAYLVVATMEDGNTSRIVLWLDDTAIAKKQLDGKAWYFVADAVNGQPVSGANVEFFGWKQEPVPNARNQYRVVTSSFAERTDKDGQVLCDPKLLKQDFQWVAIARTRQGRFAYLGFTGAWYGHYSREEQSQIKTYFISDRPVYRPEQKVQFKFWIRRTQYDQPDNSEFAKQTFTVQINDPQGVEVLKQEFTTDEFGGLAGEYALPDGAPLGVYSVQVVNHGGGTFRVEEYKKPEYEVTVEAPDKPVQLGEKVTATIRAKYYFGAPVTQATVKFKVERRGKDARWFPIRPWDWLYGSGYWWFAPDYDWYPGFSRWGCFGPVPSWWNRAPEPPELVLDQEVPIDADGTVKVEIDTALAKELHGDEDHEYTITAEVVDQSRRTIVGTGSVLVAREPFKVFAWTDRGYYRTGDTIRASFQARTPDGKPVQGAGQLKLLKITYDAEQKPVETVAQEWDLATDAQGQASQQIAASEAGHYRLSFTVKGQGVRAEGQDVEIEGGYVFNIVGQNSDAREFQFNDLELITDKAEYAPGETVKLLINTNRVGSTVLLFLRPSNGVYLPPQVLRLKGKSTTFDVAVEAGDMPNFFIEAITVSNGKLHTVAREVIVPPEQRVLDVALDTSSAKYKPGEEAKVKLKLTDLEGKPYKGSIVLTMYDRSVDAIAGGSNVPEIREFFWKWRRSYYAQTEQNLERWFYNLLKQGEIPMSDLGVFGNIAADQEGVFDGAGFGGGGRPARALGRSMDRGMPVPASAEPMFEMAADGVAGAKLAAGGEGGGGAAEMVQPTIRKEFADTAYWNAAITTADDGTAEVSLNMPENLTGWKVRAWGMGHGTRVGEASTEVVTFKNLLVRLQAPRFFVETDEVVLSAIVHNYLETEKSAEVQLVLEGDTLVPIEDSGSGIQDSEKGSGSNVDNPQPSTLNAKRVTIPAGGEVRVDWRVKAVREGVAVVTMKALTDEESDAMQMKFPVYVHGMLKTESFSGIVRHDQQSGTIEINVPSERRAEQTRLEIRYSPTLAGAMVDALPYLADYPYGCTEQTLNRFLPTVITQNILKRMNLDLAAIKEKRTNLNAQEIGDDQQRAADWARLTKGSHGKDWNPVFDAAEVELMVKVGVRDLSSMQLSDGGWGWFSGWGEQSWPHTTAVVVHGLQIAEKNGVALLPEVLPRGVAWLAAYQAEQVRLLKIGEEIAKNKRKAEPGENYRSQANDLDALVYMVLVDAGQTDSEMQKFLYRDRNKLSLYSQSMFGLALHAIGANEQRDMVIRNISQFVKTDNENQTTYIDLPNHGNYWWYWYGDVIEANAYYLKLLTKTNPQDPQCSGLVKYLLNNRRHATYWNSTRDTSVVIEALADYLVASGEAEPNMLVEVVVDGEVKQTVEITPAVLFTFDNSLVIEGEALTAGKHTIELRRKPLHQSPDTTHQSPLYYNAYLTNFTLEDHIAAAGLEIKVGRKYFKLVQREDAKDLSQGAQGQALEQDVLKYDRVEIANLGEVNSGDLVEIELEIDSKNDYEYVIFEDMKAAGFEPVELQSGYTKGGLGAYVEFRDEKVAFFMRQLARGKHSVSYRLFAETPGRFSALPTRAHAMYAPELKANSDEIKIVVGERPELAERELTSAAEYYLQGPQQASPPDGTFPAGTKVTIVREAGSYSLVRTAQGIEAFVSSGAIAR